MLMLETTKVAMLTETMHIQPFKKQHKEAHRSQNSNMSLCMRNLLAGMLG